MNEDTVDLRAGSPDVEKVGRIEAAKALSITSDIWLRGFMVAVVSSIFIWLNWQIIDLVRDAMQSDLAQMAAKPPLPATERLITSNVIMSLIGATVVQTGVGFIAITSYLFPKRMAQEA
ncbi:hypothetical protein QPK32_23670 [Massilia sp. YIM B02763]|uniref:hypothetical protein n=1 Tax=Massilia sp. YIM B02763 TaxID=3050130 RepID=UPI0025B6E7FF|nr:hypothetical protein [Massilia sp. YIM B02763]MDN4056066.1 hypothetical protein [Massilia sp. YIM B02763]